MNSLEQPAHLRFEAFELDLRTRELRKRGRLIKLQDKPARLLTLLASRAGVLVTRQEIEKALWGEDEFVEFEHGINTAIRKVREALGDDLEKPRFVETLPRKGYRFVASVETLADEEPNLTAAQTASADGGALGHAAAPPVELPTIPPASFFDTATGRPVADAAPPLRAEFAMPRGVARALFLLAQSGYLAIYCAALYKVENLEQALSRVLPGTAGLAVLVVIGAAMCGIAVRLYLLSSVGLDHPAAGIQFRKLFPATWLLDTVWAASPLLLAGQIGYGLALASVAALAYLPFAQRTLMESIHPKLPQQWRVADENLR